MLSLVVKKGIELMSRAVNAIKEAIKEEFLFP